MRKKYRTPLGRTIGFILNKRGSFCFAHFATKCCPLDTPDPDIALECARPPLRLSGSPSIDDGKSGIFVRFFGVSAERRREEKKNERWSEEEGERGASSSPLSNHSLSPGKISVAPRNLIPAGSGQQSWQQEEEQCVRAHECSPCCKY